MSNTMDHRRVSASDQGYATIIALLLVALLTAILGFYFVTTWNYLGSTRNSMARTRGYYAAEGGLNLRAAAIRRIFFGFNVPSGTGPTGTAGQLPCLAGSPGSGDFVCEAFGFDGRNVLTYLTESPDSPVTILIPPGQPYQYLNANEYSYTVHSNAVNSEDRPEAMLEMAFKSRVVPLFQFAAFYDKDLEIYPGDPMLLSGPVHTNSDLYLGGDVSLEITGQVSSHGSIYNGRKYDDCCSTSNAKVYDGSSQRSLPTTSGDRHLVTPGQQSAWNGWIRSGIDEVTVPPVETIDPSPGALYWDSADLRVMLNLHSGADFGEVQVRDGDGVVDTALTTYVNTTCQPSGQSAVDTTLGNTFRDKRENAWIQLLDVDVRRLLECVHQNPGLQGGRDLDDTTQGGLVWYFGVDGPDDTSVNNYGVRVHNGADLKAYDASAKPIQGLTIVTDQALYVEGDYNAASTNWKPAAFLTDSLNVLSNAWDDSDSNQSQSQRVADETAIYAAFLSGTDSTNGAEGSPQNGAGIDEYNGGLENYPRLHEDWNNEWLIYRGSFVSLNTPRYVDGEWSDADYTRPKRNWGYDTRFNDASKLPPLTPRFVYLRQELFVRNFEY